MALMSKIIIIIFSLKKSPPQRKIVRHKNDEPFAFLHHQKGHQTDCAKSIELSRRSSSQMTTIQLVK